eukprot:GAHX01001425.1.p1 GENE.GAHX01001425.1~~GAHX01001425.1.p1  ORF type:complete len:350 (+),score=42.60 GAHX01001425.1:319-1368(+)
MINPAILLFILLSRIHCWSYKVHRIILTCAISELDKFVKDDLDLRMGLFGDLEMKQEMPELGTIADQIRDNYSFRFMNKYHFGDVFSLKTGRVWFDSNQPVVAVIDKLHEYLLQGSKRSVFFDTFSLVYLIHMVGELFQPLHTIEKGGNDINFKGYKSLHDFWDQSCGYFGNIGMEKSLSVIKDIEKTKVIKMDSGGSISISLDEDFKKEFVTMDVLKSLKGIYSKKVNSKNNKSIYLLDKLNDQTNLETDDYKRFYTEIAITNIIHSYWTLKAILKSVYTNNENNIKKKQNDILKKIKNATDTRIKMTIKTFFIVLAILTLTIIIFVVFLKYKGYIQIGIGKEKVNKH